MNIRPLILILPLILAGCLAQSRIQAKYMDQESTCRDEAAQHVNDPPLVSPQPGGAVQNDHNTAVFAAFSACMNKAGWKVSVPKTATASTTLPPSGAPGPGGTVAAARATNVGPATPAGQPTAAPILGPGVQPNPAPAANGPSTHVAPLQPTYTPSNSPAAYEPAGRPEGVAAPDYGSGAGRQF